MFITLCENKLAFLIDAGYSFWLECKSPDYERIAWRNKDVIITVDHTSYEFALEMDIYVHGKQVDENKLFSEIGLPFRPRYEYCGAGMEKGIAYFAEALDKLINDTYWQDYDGLARKLENTTEPPPPQIHDYYLEMADQAYLSGDFAQAAHFYKQSDAFMNKLQRKRYARALSKIQKAGDPVPQLNGFSAKDAYFLYLLIDLELAERFGEIVLRDFKGGEGYEIYKKLKENFGDRQKLMGMLSPLFTGCTNHHMNKDMNLSEPNCKLIDCMVQLYKAEKLTIDEIAAMLKKAGAISGCYAFKIIAKCHAKVEEGNMDRKEFESALEGFLDKGKFNFGNRDIDILSDPNSALIRGSNQAPSMKKIDSMLNSNFDNDIILLECWGPEQMCVFKMVYFYFPKDLLITIECERGIIVFTIEDRNGNIFNPQDLDTEANYYHYEDVDKDIKQLVDLTCKAITTGAVNFREQEAEYGKR